MQLIDWNNYWTNRNSVSIHDYSLRRKDIYNTLLMKRTILIKTIIFHKNYYWTSCVLSCQNHANTFENYI